MNSLQDRREVPAQVFSRTVQRAITPIRRPHAHHDGECGRQNRILKVEAVRENTCAGDRAPMGNGVAGADAARVSSR